MNKRYIFVVIILLVIAIILIQISFQKKEIIGGSRDSHGCLIAAGYSWNESEQECIRQWLKDESRFQVTNFQQCQDAGYPILKSYIRQCKTPSGRIFAEPKNDSDNCNNLRNQIAELTRQVQACSQDSDCIVDSFTSCYNSCGIIISKNSNSDQLKQTLRQFDKECADPCPAGACSTFGLNITIKTKCNSGLCRATDNCTTFLDCPIATCPQNHPEDCPLYDCINGKCMRVQNNNSCASAGQEGDHYGKSCCSGLTPVAINKIPVNGTCLASYPPYGTQFYCISCGDNICSTKENKCNCPEDCS